MNAAAPKRSVGITFTAVVCLIGCVVFLLASFFSQFVVLMHRARPEVTPKLAFVPWTAIPELRAFAAWSAITAVGLLRRRGWARWSTILFCALTVATSVLMAIVSGSFVAPRALHGGIALVCLFAAVAALGAAWLCYLHTRGVRHQFGAVRGGPGGQRLSVWLIAWFLMIDGVICLLAAIGPLPIATLVVAFGGWAARFAFLGFAAANVWLGIALLRRKTMGRVLAIARCAFGLANCLLFVLLPGYSDRLQAIRVLMAKPTASLWSLQAVDLTEAAGWLIALCFLVVHGRPPQNR